MKTIDEGGAQIGGTMPAFGDQLSEEEKIAVISYFQAWWDDKTYERWVDMNADQ
jgi:mono/diheme cytochrome c family protein